MKKRTLLIFDGNHLAYRAYYKFPNLKTFDGVNTSIVYGIPYIMESIIRRFTPDKVIITLDGGRSPYRKGLLPSYKEREQKLGFDKEDFYRQRDDAVSFMLAFGVDVVHQKGIEADDLITMLAIRYSKKNWKAIIVSGDKDFNQLIDDKVNVYNTKTNTIFDTMTLVEKVGYHPEQCVDYLCLTGDSSDNIPGYPGIGEKRALKFLEEYGCISEYLENKQQFGKVDNNKLRDIYQLNRKLIDLRYYYVHHMIRESIPRTKGEFNTSQLQRLCRKFETNSFMKPQFINTYKSLHERY